MLQIDNNHDDELIFDDPFGIVGSDNIMKLMANDDLVKKYNLNEKSLKFHDTLLSNSPEPPSSSSPPPPPVYSSSTSHNNRSRFFNRLSARRIRKRLVEKNGEYNISLTNVEKQKKKFFSDIFTTLIELKWRWLLVVFIFSFLCSWLVFALIYYAIMWMHGDFDVKHIERRQEMAIDDRCLTNTKSFLAIFMFSLETQHTIGYGSRYPSDECPQILVALCLQSIFGLMVQTLLAGVVFAKLSRPHKRAQTLLFSKFACICMRDGRLCFLIRVGDMRKSHLAEAHVRVQLISKRVTNEGELLPFQQFDMDIGFSTGSDRIFVAWPITVCHVIDKNSPLYQYSALDLARARFEVTVILEGVVQSGATMQARSSYLPSEILWGNRFEKLVTYRRENGKYEIDFSKFHNVYEVDTPTLSAKEIDVLKDAGLNFNQLYRCDNLLKVMNSDDTPYDSIQRQTSDRRKTVIRTDFGPTSTVITNTADRSVSSCEHNRLLEAENDWPLTRTLSSVRDSNGIGLPDDDRPDNSDSLHSNASSSKTLTEDEGNLNLTVDWSVGGILERHKHRSLSTHTRKLDDLIQMLNKNATEESRKNSVNSSNNNNNNVTYTLDEATNHEEKKT